MGGVRSAAVVAATTPVGAATTPAAVATKTSTVGNLFAAALDGTASAGYFDLDKPARAPFLFGPELRESANK